MEQFESIKSKERVKELGEVFTPKEIVEDMLGLVDKASIEDMGDKVPTGYRGYSYDLDKTFLEPSCGTGNFLVEIVARKCETAISESKIEGSEQVDIDKLKTNLLKAVATVYGVDIMPDNVNESRKRVTEVIEGLYKEKLQVDISRYFRKTLEYIIERNIVLGNTLEYSMYFEFPNEGAKGKNKKAKTNKESGLMFKGVLQKDSDTRDLEFSEWKFEDNYVTRLAYRLKEDKLKDTYDKVHYSKLYDLGDKKERDMLEDNALNWNY